VPSGLLVSQVALSLVLLVGAGLLATSGNLERRRGSIRPAPSS
jgi:hypothetical protein